MKKLLFYISLLFSIAGAAQTPTKYPLRYDSVIIEKIGGNGELVVRNATRSRIGGFLQNTGNGATSFGYAVQDVYWAGDSLAFQVGPVIKKFKITAGGPGSAMTYAPPFLVEGDQVSLPGWNAPKWDSVYTWWRSNPLGAYYNASQINQYFAGTLAMPGYNKTQWDNAVNASTLTQYLKKSTADSLYGAGGAGSSLIFSNGLIQTGNKVNALPDNALWNMKKAQGFLWSPVQPLDGQSPVFRSSTQRWEFGTITSGAVVVAARPDFTETDTTSAAYIRNKPAQIQSKTFIAQVNAVSTWTDPTMVGKRLVFFIRSISPLDIIATGTPTMYEIKFETATGTFSINPALDIAERCTFMYQ